MLIPPAGDSSSLFHLESPAAWAAFETGEAGRYEMSTRDQTLDEVGFIHCSYRDQLEGTANRHYGDLEELACLEIDSSRLGAELVVEAGGDVGQQFPHVYGGIERTAVVAVHRWSRGPDGTYRL